MCHSQIHTELLASYKHSLDFNRSQYSHLKDTSHELLTDLYTHEVTMWKTYLHIIT
jgi:hypothetical protein